jgi:hypothetical protein
MPLAETGAYAVQFNIMGPERQLLHPGPAALARTPPEQRTELGLEPSMDIQQKRRQVGVPPRVTPLWAAAVAG